jgi:hypothetical protein
MFLLDEKVHHFVGACPNHLKPGISKKILGFQFEPHPQNPILETAGDDTKTSNFYGRLHMRADAWAGIIISYSDDTNLVACSLRQPIEVEALPGIISGHELLGHLHIRLDHFIHLLFNPGDFPVRQGPCKMIIALRFLFFNVGTETTSAAEKPDHGLVKDVFR